MNEHICDGVFFTVPEALPKGRHELAREEVIARQQERLMIATTELMAVGGYRAVGVREIATRARISRAAFYECFADKDDCIFAAYGRFITVLSGRVIDAVPTPADWDSTVAAVVDAYLGTLGADLVVARAFQVEMDALGWLAREQRRRALTEMAQLIKARRDEVWPGAEELPLSAYAGAVYAVRQLASDALDEAAEPDFGDLATNVGPWVAGMLGTPVAPAAVT